MKKRHNKNIKPLRYIIIGLIILAVFCFYQYSRYQFNIETPVEPGNTSNISFVINKGENLSNIAKNLIEKDLILDLDTFKWYSKLGGFDRKVVAGRFILNKNLTIPEIVEIITNTNKSQIILTIPEGSTIIDIDKKLTDLEIITAGDFIKAVNAFDDYDKYFFLNKETINQLPHQLEGYLFPDTYYINPLNFYSENLIQLMLNNFEQKIGEDLKKEQTRSINDIITMASIVEKEVRTKKDIPIVAGILWKRLDNNWLLGADATLLYLKEDRTIDYQDLKEDSKYNTRTKGGLPPGPISNPGLESLKATLYPQDSQYWFYLTTLDTGEVIYAKSNEDHNYNKAKYLN